MLKLLKLEIFENNQIIDTVENVSSTDLLKSLEAFRQKVNDKLTQKIVDDGNIEDYNIEDEFNSSEDEELPVNCGSPKKKKI